MVKIETLLKSKNYRRQYGRFIFFQDQINHKGKSLVGKKTGRNIRLNPRLYDFSYLMIKSFLETMNKFVKLVKKAGKNSIILDLGCGDKPFESLFPNSQLIGVDISQDSLAEVIADNHHLPFKDNIFDAVIASEVLEHSDNEYLFIKELRRVIKNNGLVFISLPFVFPLHGVPDDFQRFTKYKLKKLFKKDELMYLKESNNILASLFLFPNYCLRILFGSFKLIFPFYLINNLLGLVVEKVSDFYRNKKGFIGEYWEYALTSMPMGYSLIIKIKK